MALVGEDAPHTHTYLTKDVCIKWTPPPSSFAHRFLFFLDSYIGVNVHECKDYIIFFLTFWVMEVLVFLTVKEFLISPSDFYIVLSYSSPIFGTDVFYMLWQKKGHFMCQKLKSIIPCFYVGSTSLLFIFKNDFVTLLTELPNGAASCESIGAFN